MATCFDRIFADIIDLHSVVTAGADVGDVGVGGGGGDDPSDRARIDKVQQRFETTRRFLFKSLVSFTKRGVAHAAHMEQLVVVLDFNRYLSTRSSSNTKRSLKR